MPVLRDSVVSNGEDVNDEASVATADHKLCEELRDVLDTSGVASGLIANWVQNEQEAFMVIPKLAERQDFKPEKRQRIFQFYQILIRDLQLGIDCWHTAIWMLMRCLAAAPHLEASPITYVAVVLLLQKNTTSTAPVLIDLYVEKAKAFTMAQAKESGNEHGASLARDIHSKDVLGREKDILEALGWKINLPSVHTWLSALNTRMHVIFKQSFGNKIEVAFGSAVQWCSVLMMWKDTATRVPPRQLANTLFCVGLAYNGVLPLEAVLAGEAAQYEKTFSRVFGVAHPPACLVPSQHVPEVVQIVEVAICRSMTLLMEDIGAVAPLLQEFMHEKEMQQLQRAHMGGA